MCCRMDHFHQKRTNACDRRKFVREQWHPSRSKINVNTRQNIFQNQISSRSLSIALFICSALWLVSACIYGLFSGFRADWSATPLFCVLAMMVTPSVCFGIVLILVDQRKCSPLRRVDWMALIIAVPPITVGTVLSILAAEGLLRMAGL